MIKGNKDLINKGSNREKDIDIFQSHNTNGREKQIDILFIPSLVNESDYVR